VGSSSGSGFRVKMFRVKGFRVKRFRVKGFRIKGFRVKGFRIKGFRVKGFRVKGLVGKGSWVQSFRCRAPEFKLRFQGSGCEGPRAGTARTGPWGRMSRDCTSLEGSGFRVKGLGFRVQGLGV